LAERRILEVRTPGGICPRRKPGSVLGSADRRPKLG